MTAKGTAYNTVTKDDLSFLTYPDAAVSVLPIASILHAAQDCLLFFFYSSTYENLAISTVLSLRSASLSNSHQHCPSPECSSSFQTKALYSLCNHSMQNKQSSVFSLSLSEFNCFMNHINEIVRHVSHPFGSFNIT